MDSFPLSLIRSIRNLLLAQSDKQALPDYPHPNEETRQAWLTYRQALRDMTKNLVLTEDGQSALFSSIVWPNKPES
jgi:hypothetical protein